MSALTCTSFAGGFLFSKFPFDFSLAFSLFPCNFIKLGALGITLSPPLSKLFLLSLLLFSKASFLRGTSGSFLLRTSLFLLLSQTLLFFALTSQFFLTFTLFFSLLTSLFDGSFASSFFLFDLSSGFLEFLLVLSTGCLQSLLLECFNDLIHGG